MHVMGVEPTQSAEMIFDNRSAVASVRPAPCEVPVFPGCQRSRRRMVIRLAVPYEASLEPVSLVACSTSPDYLSALYAAASLCLARASVDGRCREAGACRSRSTVTCGVDGT